MPPARLCREDGVAVVVVNVVVREGEGDVSLTPVDFDDTDAFGTGERGGNTQHPPPSSLHVTPGGGRRGASTAPPPETPTPDSDSDSDFIPPASPSDGSLCTTFARALAIPHYVQRAAPCLCATSSSILMCNEQLHAYVQREAG